MIPILIPARVEGAITYRSRFESATVQPHCDATWSLHSYKKTSKPVTHPMTVKNTTNHTNRSSATHHRMTLFFESSSKIPGLKSRLNPHSSSALIGSDTRYTTSIALAATLEGPTVSLQCAGPFFDAAKAAMDSGVGACLHSARVMPETTWAAKKSPKQNVVARTAYLWHRKCDVHRSCRSKTTFENSL